MNQEERILEFDKIKDLWLEYAYTENAKEKIKSAMPVMSELSLTAALRETSQSRELLEKCGNPPLSALKDMEEILQTAHRGECLSPTQLEMVKASLVAVKRLTDYLDRGRAYDNPLAYYVENLNELEELRRQIEECIFGETVADNASGRLQDIRREISRSEEKMREKADQALRANKAYLSDSFSTMRNGHICIPVKTEYKAKISGTVIDRSSTGSTVFVEPSGSARYYESLQQLLIAEEDEVRRILYTLTVQVDSAGEQLSQNIRTVEKLDFAFSKGKLSLSYEGTAPKLQSDRVIRLTQARHPLLDKETCVPLDFRMGDDIQGVVITGPNTGGKTVALKTVALCCMMAQCGLHVPCQEAQLCMFGSFLCDIGDGQNLSENLSTFSAHITNVLDILKRINEESLVIMDELGSGTDPQEGMGIAIAILEELKKSGALFLVTTHYPEIKTYAEKEEGIINARMAIDAENLKPLYQMIIGEAGESCALQIARRLGMPGGMLRRAAQAAYGAEQTELFKEAPERLKREASPRIRRHKPAKKRKEIPFRRGDSVMVYPDQKIGIVCEEANERGALRVQLPDKKIWISYKRVKLVVAAEELYPEDYDFSIIFDTVENRKLRHDMERKNVEGATLYVEE